jgi:hypothetical protein
MKREINFVITGSEGFLSKNFIHYISDKNVTYFKVSHSSFNDDILKIKNLKLKNIVLIHNAFLHPSLLINTNEELYKKKSNELFDKVLDFIVDSDISSIFYPSSGSTKKLRDIDNNLYKPYADQKINEVESLTKLSSELGFKTIIPIIYSSIGPFGKSTRSSSLSSIPYNSYLGNDINILDKTNNSYSITCIKDLIQLSISIFSDPLCESNLLFDVGNEIIQIKDYIDMNIDIFNLDKDKVKYNFNTGKPQNYFSDNSKYTELLKRYSLNNTKVYDYLISLKKFFEVYS